MTADVHAITLLLSLLTGVGLGILFFGGLWLTVQRLQAAAHPKAFLAGSFAGRVGAVMLGFYLVLTWSGGGWVPVAVCLIGFMLARLVLVRRWGVRSIHPDANKAASYDGHQS